MLSLVLCDSPAHKGYRARLIQKRFAIRANSHVCLLCNSRKLPPGAHKGIKHSTETKLLMRNKKLGVFDGPKHPNWNPTLSQEERNKRNLDRRSTPKDFTWKREVLKRDNYQCQVFLVHNNTLKVHHLNGHAEFPEQRFDVSNGITLCKEHHVKYHSFSGVKNITKDSFYKWFALCL